MIRVGFAADIPGAADVVGSWHWNEWGPAADATERDWVARLHSWCRPEAFPILLVATHGEELVGSVALVESDLPDHPDWANKGPWLSGLSVVPEWRRRGVGTALVTGCEEHARSCGVASLLLYTNTARGLYERLGWRVISSVVYQHRPSDVMRKDLAFR